MKTLGKFSPKPATAPPGPRHSSVHFYSFAPILLGLALVWPFGGGKDVRMLAGSLDPAARCNIHVKGGDSGNTALDMKAESLAAPSALNPPKNAYVVWLQPPDQDAQNIGQLTVGSDEKGELKTVTSFKRFHVFVTAENQAQLHQPEGPVVLSADVAE